MSKMTKVLLALVFAAGALTAGQNTRAEEDADVTGLLKMFESISVGFYLDSTYQYSFNEPDSGDIGARSLYPEDNEFNLNAFTLSFEKTPTADGSLMDHLGFRADIMFGEQADLLNPSGIDSDAVSPYQAYIQVMPVEGLNLYFGQFVTLAGFEVIEAKDNPNISRAILFGFAIPFTHTGIRATYETGPFSVALGVNNGWDQWDDDNDGKTIEAQLGLAGGNDSMEGSIYVTGYFGKEQDSSDSDEWRELITVVGSLSFGPLSLYADLDFGWQEESGPEDDAFWWGIAGYAVLDAHPMVDLALRAEYFDDDDGFRGFGTTLWEITPTLIFKPFKGMPNSEMTEYLDNFEFRVEYRFDKADEAIFEDEGNADDTQHTVMAQALYWLNL
ncbi:MAG: porin [Candidatus Dadabacteria bacterium]|nr:porin [Candidatus Dadabacteria bacterium]NIS09334.1 porin [Candidatus Dadabacteria bacterium]NIV42249.1 outer membrane beta-barrel protein [Candidatus Dadabacteria bacterium]NIY22580.1 outer membrane beta-barrel protein [Candidatus Dadabacteria bacterium]